MKSTKTFLNNNHMKEEKEKHTFFFSLYTMDFVSKRALKNLL